MARHLGPRVNTVAHKIICRIVDLGGKATRRALMQMLDHDQQTTTHFRVKVVNVLERYGFIFADDHSLTATAVGKNYVAEFMERNTSAVPRQVGQVATPRVALPERPLDLRKHMPRVPRREGSMDFLTLPSIMGNQRIVRSRAWQGQ